MLQALLQ